MMRVSDEVILVTVCALTALFGFLSALRLMLLTMSLSSSPAHGVHGVFDHVGAALGTGEFGHVRGSGVDDGILVAAGVDDAGDAEFGAVVIHDVGRDAAVFRGLRGLFALRSLRTLRALRGRFCRFS